MEKVSLVLVEDNQRDAVIVRMHVASCDFMSFSHIDWGKILLERGTMEQVADCVMEVIERTEKGSLVLLLLDMNCRKESLEATREERWSEVDGIILSKVLSGRKKPDREIRVFTFSMDPPYLDEFPPPEEAWATPTDDVPKYQKYFGQWFRAFAQGLV